MRRRGKVLLVAAAIGGIAYPFAVFVALPYISPRLLLIPALALVVLRVLGGRNIAGRAAIGALILSAIALAILGWRAPDISIRAYPVLMSFSAAIAFGASLWRGPSLVETFARRSNPHLPPRGVRYTWWVTVVWFVFLLGNTGIAAITAIWGTLEQWALWNGLLSYFAAGTLMAVEYTVRRFTMSAAAQPLGTLEPGR